jgi:hypothetical protein
MAATGLTVFALAQVTASGGSSGSPQTPAASAFWESLRITGMQVEHYDSLSSMTKSADIVASGMFVDFKLSREVQTSTGEDAVAYGVATLQVAKVLAGDAGKKAIAVEFLLPDAPLDLSKRIASMKAVLPAENVVVFLRHKGGGEAGLYRLVNSWGLWTSDNRTLTAPLVAVEAEADTGRTYTTELSKIADLDGLGDLIAKNR